MKHFLNIEIRYWRLEQNERGWIVGLLHHKFISPVSFSSTDVWRVSHVLLTTMPCLCIKYYIILYSENRKQSLGVTGSCNLLAVGLNDGMFMLLNKLRWPRRDKVAVRYSRVVTSDDKERPKLATKSCQYARQPHPRGGHADPLAAQSSLVHLPWNLTDYSFRRLGLLPRYEILCRPTPTNGS